MKKLGKYVPYLIVLAFCLINLGVLGPSKENKSSLPFFNWCLFCSSDIQHVKYYEIQIQKKNGPTIVLDNKNNKNQIDFQNVKKIISMHRRSQLTTNKLKEILGSENASVSLFEISCDVHEWFVRNTCGPTNLLATYEI